ncbi:MAG: Fe-S cluster domain-containing protein [Oscillospiraceae bacterium]|nr:Fe-S cluster domain-containing protein [Oscillospiraceae bacterium]
MKYVILAIVVLGVMGGIFGAILAFASKIFYVEVDPKQAAVRECLAGANCGGCGFAGCDGYAAAVAKGEAPTNKCVAAGEEAAKKIAEIMGVSADGAVKMVAFVPCSGTEGVAVKRFNYRGPQNCQAAMLFGGKSNMDCRFACIGLGNCVNACQFGAMHIVDGVAKADSEQCVGCGACVNACPKKIVKLIPYAQHVMPACSSCDKGAVVMKACDAGCIGCMKCQKECPADAIVVENNLARINVSKCVQCGHCADICPRKIIKVLN